MTARRRRTLSRVSQTELGNPVVVTLPNQLFYWRDCDIDGKFYPDLQALEKLVGGHPQIHRRKKIKASLLLASE